MFSDFGTAQKFRDLVADIARRVLERERPRYDYATVASIDRANRKATVTFAGESTPITVGMGSIQPAVVGQTVRIDGLVGDRFIADVMGEGRVADSGWVSMTMQNGWVSYDTSEPGGGWSDPAIRRIGSLLIVKGLVKNGTATNGTSIATFPSGFNLPSGQGYHKPVVSADQIGFVRYTSAGVETGLNCSSTWLDISTVLPLT